MGRRESIELIQSKLELLGEEELQAIVELTSRLAERSEPYELTEEERAGIERSREDFKAGRTYTFDEAKAFLEARRAGRAAE